MNNSLTVHIVYFIAARDIIEGAVVLHNLLRKRVPVIPMNEVDHENEDHNLVPSSWRDEVQWQDVDYPPNARNRDIFECETAKGVP